MADALTLAQAARKTLANALEALQSDPALPDEVVDIAEPIAKAMGVLHRIERSGGNDLTGREQALDEVRSSLDKLQTCNVSHAAIDQAMEAVAGSLSKMFALARAAPPAAAKAAEPPRAAEPQRRAEPPRAEPPRAEPPRAEPVRTQPVPVRAEPARPEPRPQPRPEPRQEQPAAWAAHAQGGNINVGLEATLPVEDTTRPAPRQPAAHHQPAPHQPAAHHQPAQHQPAQHQPAQHQPAAPPAARSSSAGPWVDVELGAHSGSNFYKGLSGNDVIEHGGIFVQTYKIPKVGTAVALRVHLPGDLEFEGDAIVQWTRDTRSGETDPGFGAKFTRISSEGRQLVYRYTRNREPIFYDDM